MWDENLRRLVNLEWGDVTEKIMTNFCLFFMIEKIFHYIHSSYFLATFLEKVCNSLAVGQLVHKNRTWLYLCCIFKSAKSGTFEPFLRLFDTFCKIHSLNFWTNNWAKFSKTAAVQITIWQKNSRTFSHCT